jgi:hypothetical protein
MKVFFTCSTKDIDKHGKNYLAIRDEILSLGHKIERDWIDYSINVAQRNIPDIPTYRVYGDVMGAITTADAVVVDSSVRSMSLGHQLTYALQKGKPVLLVRAHNENARKKLFIEGSENNDLVIDTYKDNNDIKRILKSFFNKYDDKTVKRFNLVLSGAEDSYISWAAFNNKKTKTEIIQVAIDQMAERDTSYKKYLSRQS